MKTHRKILMIQRLDSVNYLRNVNLYCDGKKLGSLGFAERLEFEIDADAKEVYAKIDWCTSKKIKLDSNKLEETLMMECDPSYRNMFLHPKYYLKLYNVDAMDLPSFYQLTDYKKNFKKVALTSSLVLVLFTFFFAYSLFVAVYEHNNLWYILAIIALYQMYKIVGGIRSRVRGIDPHC